MSQPIFCSFRPRLRGAACGAGVFFSVALLLCFAPFSARAQTMTYTSQSTFLSNVQSGYYLENFNTGAEDNAASYNYSSGGFAYTVTAGTATVPSNVYQSGSIIGTFDTARILTFTFSSGNVTAVGGNFFQTDSGNQFTTQNVTINLSNGTSTTFTPSATASFRGFTTTSAITSLSIAAPSSEFFASADDFIVGRRIGAVDTPEPGSLPLTLSGLVAGIGAWGASRFRKRRAS